MFNQIARVSEYIKPEPGGRDHCVRGDNLAFEVRASESERTRRNGQEGRCYWVSSAQSDYKRKSRGKVEAD